MATNMIQLRTNARIMNISLGITPGVLDCIPYTIG